NGTSLQTIATNLPNSGSYSWSVPAGTYVCGNIAYIQLRAFDCAGNFTNANSSNFTIDNLTITTQPNNAVICSATGNATISIATSSNCGGQTYQWEYGPTNSGPWSSVSNGTPTNATYTGATSASLIITSNTPGIPTGNYYYRCIVTSTCGTSLPASNSGKLEVVSPLAFGPTYPTNPSPQIIGNPITLTFNYTGGTSNRTYKLYKYSNSICSAGQTLVTSGSITSNPFTISYGTVDCNTTGYYDIVIEDDCPTIVSGSCIQIVALAPEPTTQAYNISGGRTRTTISLLWTDGNGMGRLVAAKAGTTTTQADYSETSPANDPDLPWDGTQYGSGSSVFTSAPALNTGASAKLLYNGTGSSVYVTNLSANTWYTFRVFEYNYNTSCASTSYNYNINTATFNPRAIKTTTREVGDEEVLVTKSFAITPIWPNPVENTLQFDLLIQKAANFKVEIVDMSGRTVFTHEYNYDAVATTVMIMMDRSVFAPGAYMLRVSALGETVQQPFIFMP
ncbi:MAG: T9SS type A sorting domain-containing protein, partial [Ignavibacteria bacterium]|nr:T9SS type A sorting domain-containing protein [Ignavibacteria bacterium]